MMTFEEVVAAIAPLEAPELERWIANGWVSPGRERAAYRFSEVDVARVHLICDMRYELMIDDEAMPVVLGLLDQVYSLRRQLRLFERALQTQPDEVRAAITAAIDGLDDDDGG